MILKINIILRSPFNVLHSVLVVILSSTLASGIVQDSLLEKLEKASAGGEVETTGGYFCHQDRKFFPFPSN